MFMRKVSIDFTLTKHYKIEWIPISLLESGQALSSGPLVCWLALTFVHSHENGW